MTGYDIKKRVKVMLSAVTNASYGTLYPTLHKLLEEGAVDVDEIPQSGRPSKKVYRITPTGREDLRLWLLQPAAADQVKREFLLKIYLGKDLPPHHLRTIISKRRDEVKAMLQALHKEQDKINNQQHAWVMDYTLALYRTEMRWLEKLEAEIGVA